jgi:hypothetical protein
MNMDDLMAEIDGAWPKGMPPEQLDVVVSTEDQVLLDIKGLTLQMINDRETVVIEFEPVDFTDVKEEELDLMIEFLAKQKLKLAARGKNANTDKGRDSGSDAKRVVADDQEEHEGNDNESEDSDSEVVAAT